MTNRQNTCILQKKKISEKKNLGGELSAINKIPSENKRMLPKKKAGCQNKKQM